MNINFKSTNTRLTGADKNYITDKLRLLGRLAKDSDKFFVEAEVDKKHKSGLNFRVEISINPPRFYSEARGNDYYEAADLCLQKIKEQMLRKKDKQVSLRRRKTKASKIL